MEEQLILEGVIEDIVFANGENGYTVCSMQTEEEEVICVGILPGIHPGESLRVVGSWVTHPTYGEQFQVELYEKSIPKTVQGIEKYLGSGVIKGIGPKMAKRIVKKFGIDTLRIIEEEPERLQEIKGISEEKAQSIGTIFHEQRELRRAILFLQEYGISPIYALKIYKQYKEQTIEVIKANPYRLADDIFGIGFKMADQIAQKVDIHMDSPHRIKAGIKYILNQNSNNGHVYLPKKILTQECSELLQVPGELLENGFLELQIHKQIMQEQLQDEVVVYLSAFYYGEIAVARKLLDLSQHCQEQDDSKMEEQIKALEQTQNIQLAPNQRTAVREAVKNGVLIITGGPGTGKTTTINTIIRLLEQEGCEIILAAPTGRAAKRMTEATGMEAQTIHRLLEISFLQEDSRKQTFEKNEDNPIDADVIIIDETSMVDILLMNSLLKAITPSTRLILVGDVDQLPSVGPGNVLKDMIRSQRLKVVRLTEVFRQARESAIVMNAHRINQGAYPTINEKEKDFFFVKRAVQEEVVRMIVELAADRLPKYIACDARKDIQILTPMKKSPLGVQHLNKVLQEALNPPTAQKTEKEFRTTVFREGDKVMQIKNNYNISWKTFDQAGIRIDEGVGVFNGDSGVIKSIDQDREILAVAFEDSKIIEYDFSQLDELELSYAVTIHKSQGSEYPVVILPIYNGPALLMSRNLLYTAVTRAKQLVVIVGLQSTLHRMVDNNREISRYSSLAYRIEQIHDFMM